MNSEILLGASPAEETHLTKEMKAVPSGGLQPHGQSPQHSVQ